MASRRVMMTGTWVFKALLGFNVCIVYLNFRFWWLRRQIAKTKQAFMDQALLHSDAHGRVHWPIEPQRFASLPHLHWRHFLKFWCWDMAKLACDREAWDLIHGPLLIAPTLHARERVAAVMQQLDDPNVRAALAAAREAGKETFTLPDGTVIAVFNVALH